MNTQRPQDLWLAVGHQKRLETFDWVYHRSLIVKKFQYPGVSPGYQLLVQKSLESGFLQHCITNLGNTGF